MKTVLCFGDSNTYGTHPMPHLSYAKRFGREIRWPTVMASGLGSTVHLIDEGHPGRTTVHDDPIEGLYKNGSRILTAILESHCPIDLLILNLGANDHKQRFGLTTQDIAFGVGVLVDMAKASGLVRDTLVICPPKVQEKGCLAEIFAGAKARSDGLADHMARVAKARDVHFVDAGAHIETDPLDGVHYSDAAHQKLAGVLVPVVKDILEEQGE